MRKINGWIIEDGTIDNSKLKTPPSAITLSGLPDVIDTNKAEGRILQVNADGDHEYIDIPVVSGATQIVELDDVDITNKADGKILQVRADGKHEYVDMPSPGGGGVTELVDLTDVDPTNKATDMTLVVRSDGKHEYVPFPSGTGEPTSFAELVSSLPVANLTNRGRMVQLTTGVSGDELYFCKRLANGDYEWKQIG